LNRSAAATPFATPGTAAPTSFSSATRAAATRRSGATTTISTPPAAFSPASAAFAAATTTFTAPTAALTATPGAAWRRPRLPIPFALRVNGGCREYLILRRTDRRCEQCDKYPYADDGHDGPGPHQRLHRVTNHRRAPENDSHIR
jgi:hypothetical protein